MAHWLNVGDREGAKLPKIFHVNWFRKNSEGKFLWPGFGENSRVLEWIFRRVEGQDCAEHSAIGLVPKEGSLNLEGMTESVNTKELFDLPKDFWSKEVTEIKKYFDEQLQSDLPEAVAEELEGLRKRVNDLS